VTEVSEGADDRDDERDVELILRAHLPEVDAAILDGEAAAVVTNLNDLVLQRLVLEIVADTGDEIKSLAGFASVADEPVDLVRKRLLERYELGRQGNGQITLRGIVVQAEMDNGGEKFPIQLYFQEHANGDQSLELEIVLKNLLQVVEAAGSDLKIADDRRPVAGTGSESERRDGVERLKNVALAVVDGVAKGRIKIVLLDDASGNELLRLAVTFLPEEPLCKAIFNFAGVSKSGVGIEMDQAGEMIHAGDVAVGESGFEGVLVPAPSLVLLQGSAVEESFERRRAELDRELASVAGDGSGADLASGSEGIAVARGAKSGGSGHAEPLSEVHWNGDPRREFVAIDEIGSFNILIAAVEDAGKGVETEIEGALRQGACSMDPRRASGTLRSVTLVAGTAGVVNVAATGSVRKLLSLRPPKFTLKPRKLFERKRALRTSELVASPKESAKARRKVSEERWL
jgi:hypothetical protein